MKGSRPEQAPLTRDNDLSKTEETRAVVEGINAVLALFDQAQPALKAPKRKGLKGQFMQVLRVRPLRHGRHRVARRAPD